MISEAVTSAQLPLLFLRHCHCQLRFAPEAATLKIAVLPSAAVALNGPPVIVGFVAPAVTVRVAALEYTVPHGFLTLQRY